MGYDYEKCLSGYLRGIFSGDGRSRTAVQTKPRRAFYTLILPLIVGGNRGGRRPQIPLIL